MKGVNYFETYAPTLSLNTFRTLMSFAAMNNLTINNFDITTAFLYGIVDADIYVEVPQGLDRIDAETLKKFKDPVVKLNKTLHEIRQAPRQFATHLR